MIYAILGPTASGKSDLAENISHLLNDCPIINFDAFQVYKEIEKGTAKPNKDELASGRYFLYDFVSIENNYDISKYQKDARELLEHFKDKDIILVGGTGLYLKALLYDYTFKDEEPMPHDFLSDKSNEELYDELIKIDKEDALKIGVNNRKRLLRALYIYSIHNASKTEINQNGKEKLLYDVTFIGLDIDRPILYERINNRVDQMFENGLPEEANYIFTNYDNELRALQAIGYKEFLLGLNLEDTKELIKKNTRNYAKRQMTFFKHQFKKVNWFNFADDAIYFIKSIL